MKKISEYNIIVPYKEKFIYFNSYTNFSVALSPKEHEVIQEALKNLSFFEENYPTIFKKFCNTGFLIDSDKNEKEEILFNKKKGVFSDKDYHLIINPTLDCNFNCWYCYEKHPKEKMSENVFNRIKKHIEQKADEITGISLAWFGGEPLMCFDEIVKPLSLFTKNLIKIRKKTFSNSITTNAYLIDKEMIECFKEIDFKHFQITLDGNKEKHDKVRKHYGQPSFDKIYENIILICENIQDVHVTLRINYDGKTFDYGLDFLENFPENIRHKINVYFHRVWQTYYNEKTEKINKHLIKNMEFAINLGFLSYFWRLELLKKYACYADRLHELHINYDGKLYKCTAKDYSSKYEVGQLNEDGTVKLNYSKEAKRFCKLTIENDLCLNCKYLPMCGGYCGQNYETLSKPNCIQKYFEIPFETAIIKNYEYKNKFYEIFKKINNIL